MRSTDQNDAIYDMSFLSYSPQKKSHNIYFSFNKICSQRDNIQGRYEMCIYFTEKIDS